MLPMPYRSTIAVTQDLSNSSQCQYTETISFCLGLLYVSWPK